MQYKFKIIDGITNVTDKDDNIITRYKLDYRWKEVNYSLKSDGFHIRLFDQYKRYKDIIVKIGTDEIQEVP